MRVPLSLLLRLLPVLVLGFLFSSCSGDKKARFEQSAKKFFDAGEYDKAKIEYQNLLREDPKNVTAISQLGLIWMEQGAPLRALEFLSESRRLAPEDLSIRLRFVKAVLALGQPAMARKELLEILDKNPASGEALMFLMGTARSKEELADNRGQVEKFPDRKSPFYHLASAQLLLQDKDLAGAETAINAALAADPQSLPAHAVMSVLCLMKKDMEGAEKAMKAASDLAPMRGAERVQYAEFKANAGKPDEARALLAEITKQAPDVLPAWILTARLANDAKQFDDALAALENVHSRDPGNFMARLLQAEILMGKGEPAKAVGVIEQLAVAHPEQPMVQYQLGRAYFLNAGVLAKDSAARTKANAEITKASTALTKAVALLPNFPKAAILLSELNLRQGQGAQVVSAMRALLEKQPDLKNRESAAAASLLVDALMQQRSYKEGAAVMEQLVAADPSNAQNRLRLGRLFSLAGEADKARAAFAEAAKLAPGDFNSAAALIDLEIAQKRPDEALRMAREITAKSPESPVAHFMEGRVQAARDAWAESEAALQKAIDLDPGFFPAYYLLIESFVKLNKLAPALERLEQVLVKQPQNLQAWMQAALIHEKLKDFEKARDGYEKLLAINPDVPAALNNLAVIYATHLNQLDKALELASKARGLRPAADDGTAPYFRMESASIADTLGWLHYQKGNYAEAFSMAQDAAQQLGDVPEVQFHLGMAASMMGRREEALAALVKADAAPGDFPGKASIKARLALLKPAEGQIPATDNLKALLAANPGDVLVQTLLAEALEKQGDFPAAAAAWEAVLKRNPKMALAALKLARLNAGPLKNRAKALEFAGQAQALDRTSAEATGILGLLHFEDHNYAKAYPLLKESSSGTVRDAGILYGFAWSAYHLSRVGEAREVMLQFQQAEKDTPRAAEAAQFLALTAPEDPARDQAALLATAEGVLATNPGFTPALMLQAASKVKAGDSAAAAASLTKILETLPDFAPAQAELAAIYADIPDQRSKGYDLARKARDTLSALGEKPEALARTLAVLSVHQKNYTFAAELFKEAPPAGPREAEQLFYQGIALWNLNQKEEGQTKLKSALATQRLPEALAAEANRILALPAGN